MRPCHYAYVLNTVCAASYMTVIIGKTVFRSASVATIPAGYLLCNDVAVSRTSYAALFGVISTLYGSGDGTTSFNLPDLRNRFLKGAGTNALAAYLEAGLPNITGDSAITGYWDTHVFSTGCFATSPEWDANVTFNTPPKNGYNSSKAILFDASKSNAIYSKSQTVQPNAIAGCSVLD